MGWVKWLVYIASFFIPVFGFVTFWVFSVKGDKKTAKWAMAAGFFGIVLYVILATLGITMFGFLWQYTG